MEGVTAARRTAAATLQRLLPGAVRARATHLHRRAATTAVEGRLRGRAPVPEEERSAVLDAEQDARARRPGELHER